VTPVERAIPLVLVVDDQDAGRFAKTQIVRRARFEVCEASTGYGALKLAEDRDPDLVVLDVNLPDLSGVEVCRQLKARPRAVPLQIVHMSATAIADADRVRGLDGGADAYLIEPVSPDLLVATLTSLERVRQAETELARANRIKDEFLAVLSHELRTPLNVTLGWLAQLRRGGLSPAHQQRALEAIERGARHQWRIVNDLLDIARIDNGKLDIEFVDVNLVDIVRLSIDAVEHQSRVRITFQAPADPIVVAGDGSRLQQVIVNLLSNAAHFTPADGSITVTVDSDGRSARIVVEDTGGGIEPELLPHLFERFRQSPDPERRRHKGLGLGLAIAHGIVEAHRGALTASSGGIGRGATFTVTLPAVARPTA